MRTAGLLAARRVAAADEEPELEHRPWEPLTFPEAWLGPASPRKKRMRRAAAKSKPKVKRRRSKQLRFKFPRKCSALPRAKSFSATRLTKREREDARILAFLEQGWDNERPRVRGDCVAGIRPCPWVGCSKNLYLDVAENGSIKINFPGREPSDMPADASCVLDIADRVAQDEQPLKLETVGLYMNLGIERANQLVRRGLQAARVKKMREERLVKVRLPDGRRR